jgi:hypothetical protein
MVRRSLKVSKFWIGVGVVLLMTFAGVFAWQQRAHSVRLDECKQNMQELALAVEQWQFSHTLSSTDHVERYPEDFSTIVKDGFLKHVPLNPYTKSPVHELKPGDSNTLGDFRYVPVFYSYQFADGSSTPEIQDFALIVYIAGKAEASMFHPVMLKKLGPEPWLQYDSSHQSLQMPPGAISSSGKGMLDAITRAGY